MTPTDTTPTETTPLQIGSDVLCTDGIAGSLSKVIVDPARRVLTHLVVEPPHGRRPSRLVPVGLVAATGTSVSLRCSTADFDGLEDAVETHFLPGGEESWGYRQEHIGSWPFYPLAAGRGMGLGTAIGTSAGGLGGASVEDLAEEPQLVTRDRIPTGEVEIRRGERVHAADGDIGRVRGLVVDPEQHVTHVLLDEGHLWGKKLVAIPIGLITDVEHGVVVALTKDELAELPPVDLDDVW